MSAATPNGARTIWTRVGRTDGRARALADKHYSRKHIGAAEFCPPGNNIVLLHLVDEFTADALWVSHRPDPSAGLARPRFDGFDYWDNPFFRNESELIASEMIREAIAISLHYWWRNVPRDGFHSFVDPKQVKPVMRHSQAVYGWCFDKAGFDLSPQKTADKKLLRYILPRERLIWIEPLKPQFSQQHLFEVA